jgi:hypothetical protein
VLKLGFVVEIIKKLTVFRDIIEDPLITCERWNSIEYPGSSNVSRALYILVRWWNFTCVYHLFQARIERRRSLRESIPPAVEKFDQNFLWFWDKMLLNFLRIGEKISLNFLRFLEKILDALSQNFETVSSKLFPILRKFGRYISTIRRKLGHNFLSF